MFSLVDVNRRSRETRCVLSSMQQNPYLYIHQPIRLYIPEDNNVLFKLDLTILAHVQNCRL